MSGMKSDLDISLTPAPKVKPKQTAEEWPTGCDANPSQRRHPFTVTCGKCEHSFPLEQGLAVDMSAIMMRCPRCNRSIDYNQDMPDEPFQPEDDGW